MAVLSCYPVLCCLPLSDCLWLRKETYRRSVSRRGRRRSRNKPGIQKRLLDASQALWPVRCNRAQFRSNEARRFDGQNGLVFMYWKL